MISSNKDTHGKIPKILKNALQTHILSKDVKNVDIGYLLLTHTYPIFDKKSILKQYLFRYKSKLDGFFVFINFTPLTAKN